MALGRRMGRQADLFVGGTGPAALSGACVLHEVERPPGGSELRKWVTKAVRGRHRS